MDPSPVVLNKEDEPLRSLALKITRAYIWETQRTVENKDSTCKGNTQNFIGSGN